MVDVTKSIGTNVPHKEFTVSSFLNNPTGDSGNSATARKLMLEALSAKLYKLTKAGRPFTPVSYKAGESLFIKVEIPSETFEDFSYDVVIEFVDGVTAKDLNGCNVRFFSNSPSFVYTYANVFKVYGVFIEPLEKQINKKAFEELPKIRNPDFSTFYEKSITLALLYIREKSLLDRSFTKDARTIPTGRLHTIVAHSEDKELHYKQLKAAESKKKKAEKEASSIKAKKTAKVASTSSPKPSVTKKVNSTVSKKVNSKLDMKVKNRIK